jgi:hypothetical protein
VGEGNDIGKVVDMVATTDTHTHFGTPLPLLSACPQGGRILGCQAVGEGEGVDKVVDVMATLIQKDGTVYDLEEAELCYGQ